MKLVTLVGRRLRWNTKKARMVFSKELREDSTSIGKKRFVRDALDYL